jgi:pyridoxal biosynthesis lyase PdxS
MKREEQYCMTKREMQKLFVINKVIDGVLTASEAAQVLDLSVSQVFILSRLKNKAHPVLFAFTNYLQ